MLHELFRFFAVFDLCRVVGGDEHGAVNLVADDLGIGDGKHRRRVDDDDIVDAARLLQQPLHTLRTKQLGRVRRDRPARQQFQPRLYGLLYRLLEIPLLGEQVREAVLVRCVERVVVRRLSQVGVDQKHALLLLGKYDGEVGGRRGLALFRCCRRDGDRLDRRIGRGELDVGPDRAVLFGNWRLRHEMRNQAALLRAEVVFFLLFE